MKQFIGNGEVKGFKFTQISKTRYGFIYQVNTGDNIYYEIFERRINRRFACESYPTSKAFGVWAKTTSDLSRAYEILNEMSVKEDISL